MSRDGNVTYLTTEVFPWVEGVYIVAMTHGVEDAGTILGSTHG